MEGLALIRQGIVMLQAQHTDETTDQQLVDAMTEFHQLESLFAAQRSRYVNAVDARGLWRTDGSKACWAWLARTCDMAPNAAKALTGLSKRLRLAPCTRAAFETGDIDRDRAVQLSQSAGSPRKRVADAFPAAEADLVTHAKTLTFDGLCRLLRYWEARVDEDGEESQGQDDYRSRHLHASEMLRGMVRIDGTLDPVSGAIFTSELTRITTEMFKADWAAAKKIHGDNTTTGHIARTPAQRRADALAEMARRSAGYQPGTNSDGTPRPLFSVHIGPDVVGRLCELASGTVIAPGLLVPHLGEADIERIVYGPGSRVIDLSKQARFFRGGLRRAIQLRDRFCTHPGCDELAENCAVDHITPHSHDGRATQQNGRARCDTHNWWAWNHQQRHTNDGEPPSHNDTS